ncbi:MAG: baseplate J/gp47 family protein [Coleofasciculaceae cyanobacterium]
MTTPQFGVTPQGFKVKRLIQVKNQLENLFIGEFGDVNLDPQSVVGQLVGIFSKMFADNWENQQDIYLSQYLNSASGISLDNVVQLTGITRLPAQRTTVIGVATGQENTLIPDGSLARLINGQVFFTIGNAFITSSNSVQNIIEVVPPPAAQEYRIVIDNISYIYSLPSLNFSGPLVSTNSINLRINGINIPTVNYMTSNAATLANLASVIVANSPSVASAIVNGSSNGIDLVPNLGYSITISNAQVLGTTPPTPSVAFRMTSLATVAQYLSANINLVNNLTSTWIPTQTTFTITAVDTEFPYSISVGSGLRINQVSSPIPFSAQTYGPIAVPANSLTEILTPIAGWQSLTNFQAGITGRNIETDTELRIRRTRSLKISGSATLESIKSRILQDVAGVTSVFMFENVTMTQDPSTVTFSQDFVSGNIINVSVDGVTLGNITYVIDNLSTMTNIANLLKTSSSIDNAVVGGTGNHEITITYADGQDVEVAFNISVGSIPNYIISGGRPAKSFEAVVQGGTNQAVADEIWLVKPAGIRSYGNTQVPIIDSQGNTQQIYFTRGVPVYIFVNVVLTLNPQETFPANGQDLVSQAISDYGNSLGIGTDVFIQRVQAAVFTVSGIASATIQIARTNNPNDTPTYVSTNILIADTEISAWDVSRINVSVI